MTAFDLPSDFIRNIHHSFGADGRVFLSALPDLVDEACRRWSLSEVEALPALSYNFVAFARGAGGAEVVLKIGVPNPELNSETAALRLINGDGACRLLDSDPARGFLLLERLRPGTMLSALADDDLRTETAVAVMRRLWRDPGAEPGDFIQLRDWFDGLKGLRPRFDGGTGPFPKRLIEQVEADLPALFSDPRVTLLHGDFHHFNILQSERGWLAIDPKGVIGPAGYEIGPLMINPWNEAPDGAAFRRRAERRVAILAAQPGWDRDLVLSWSAAHAVLSAWWDMQSDGSGADYPLFCAAVFAGMR